MISALAPLGAKYNLTLAPEYSADGTVSVAVIYKLKGDKDAAPKTLSFSGTVAEVEQAIAEQLPKAVEKLVAHATNLEELDKELAAAEAEKKKEVESKKAKKSPATKPVAKATTKSKPTPAAKKPAPSKPATKDAKAAAKSEAMKRAAATRKKNQEAKATAPVAERSKATPASGGLTPAWKGKAASAAAAPTVSTVASVGTETTTAKTEDAPVDLGSLFPS